MTKTGRVDGRAVVGGLLGLAVLACWAMAVVWFVVTVFRGFTTMGPAG